jgi:hypothetical protein
MDYTCWALYLAPIRIGAKIKRGGKNKKAFDLRRLFYEVLKG